MRHPPPVVADWRSCSHPEDRRVHASFQRGRKPKPGAPVSGWYCLDCGVNLASAESALTGEWLTALREISEAAQESTKRKEPGDSPDA